MESAVQVFRNYALAFEETYGDDDWSRLTPFFAEGAHYEVRGGPLACTIEGRDAIFRGLKKSLDGLDRRCDSREIEITDGPHARSVTAGDEVSLDWVVSYRRGNSPRVSFAGRSRFIVADGRISAMRDEYSDDDMKAVGDWMARYGQDLDGTYI